MTTLAPSPVLPPSLGRRVLAWPLVRIVLAMLITVAPVALVLITVRQMLDKSARQIWPQLLCAVLCIAAYRWYVRMVEQRRADELARAGAGAELAGGALLGALMFGTVVGMLFVSGAFSVAGTNDWTALFAPLAEMVVVACAEELVFRGVLFRITEQSQGSWVALIVSAVLFALAHAPNEHVTVLAIVCTLLAGVMFAAAYLASGRLWLPIGIHFAWNTMSDAVFSLPTSGHPGRGLIALQTGGPDWLSGGAYGVEASVITLALLAAVSVGLLSVATRAGRIISRAQARRARAA